MPFPLRIDVNSLPALVVGALLLCAAAFVALKQWWAHRQLIQNMKVTEAGYQIAERQIRHRLAVGFLLFLLAVAIPLGDQFDILFRARPGLFFAYWMGVLLLVFGMVVIALGDILSTLAYARISQVELRHERHELEEEIRRFRKNADGDDSAKNQSPPGSA